MSDNPDKIAADVVADWRENNDDLDEVVQLACRRSAAERTAAIVARLREVASSFGRSDGSIENVGKYYANLIEREFAPKGTP